MSGLKKKKEKKNAVLPILKGGAQLTASIEARKRGEEN